MGQRPKSVERERIRKDAIRRMHGYVPPKPDPDDGYRLIPFENKKEKWEYMKSNELADVYLIIKKLFGTGVPEPIISRKEL